MNRFKISDTPLDGLKLLERLVLRDPRGSLERMFCANARMSALSVGMRWPVRSQTSDFGSRAAASFAACTSSGLRMRNARS